jgi:N utilization substance protein B
MQALYQWQMTGNSLADIEAQFQTDYDFSKVDSAYFHELVHRIPANIGELEAGFGPYLQGREMSELDPIELALLRLGSYELMRRIDIPYKVAINEAVSLAKKFGASDGHKYINAVLDKLAQEVRAVEVRAGQTCR